MRLYAYRRKIENLWDVPSLYLQKFMAEEFEAVTKLSFSSKSEGEKAEIGRATGRQIVEANG